MAASGQAPQTPADPQAPPARAAAPTGCRVTGKIISGTTPLPGATVVVTVGQTVKAATSADAEGKFTIIFGPNTTYHVRLVAKSGAKLLYSAPRTFTTGKSTHSASRRRRARRH